MSPALAGVAAMALLIVGIWMFRPSDSEGTVGVDYSGEEESEDAQPSSTVASSTTGDRADDEAPEGDSEQSSTSGSGSGDDDDDDSESDDGEAQTRAEIAAAMKSDAETSLGVGGDDSDQATAEPREYLELEGVEPGTPVLGREVEFDLLIGTDRLDMNTGELRPTGIPSGVSPMLAGDGWVAMVDPGDGFRVRVVELRDGEATGQTHFTEVGYAYAGAVASSDPDTFWVFGTSVNTEESHWALIEASTGKTVRVIERGPNFSWPFVIPELVEVPGQGTWVLDEPRAGEFRPLTANGLVGADGDAVLTVGCVTPEECEHFWIDRRGEPLDVPPHDYTVGVVAVAAGGAFVVGDTYWGDEGAAFVLVRDRNWERVELDRPISAAPDGSFLVGYTHADDRFVIYDPVLGRTITLPTTAYGVIVVPHE